MEKAKENPKKEKVGADGLTKKERRALKVQEKQTPDILQPSIRKDNAPVKLPQKKTYEPREQDQKITQVKENKLEVHDKKQAAQVQVQLETNQLSEKELRKLEWDRKLMEQKNTGKQDLSKAELKAKRREQQEAQRLSKTIGKIEPTQKPLQTPEAPVKLENIAKKETAVKKGTTEIKKTSKVQKVQLVQHLYAVDSIKSDRDGLLVHNDVHPAFVRLGVQFSRKSILGSNARCLALLAALKHLVDDTETPPKQEFCRYLETVLQTCTNHLQNCRQFAVSMTNAVKHFKLQLTQVDTNLGDKEKRAKLRNIIDIYINDDIRKAGDAISLKVNEKIADGDVILTFGCSSLIRKILLDAHKDGKKFKVIIVDSRPLLEGKEMLRRLVVAGVNCTYILINAVSYIMNSVTKVVLGAHALLTNGYVMSRIGTAQVALVARAYNKPVLVCCETYKFSEKVQTDSFVYNELDDEDALTSAHITDETSPLSKWKTMAKLAPLNLLYDVTPPDLVTAVVTEIAILPCTSVPVVLRINANETA